MNKRQFTNVSAALFLLILLCGVTYALVDVRRPETESSQAKPDVNPSLESFASNTPQQIQTSPNSNLQVQGATSQSTTPQGTTPQNNTSPQLPGPESFTAYEELSGSMSTQYIDIVAGDGAVASRGDTVAVVYQGWLTNGTLFDQTRLNDQNQLEAFGFTIGSGQVIPGWDQGINGMKEGGKRRLIIPSQFAYGESGQGEIIPPNAMLIFDVELAQVEKAQP